MTASDLVSRLRACLGPAGLLDDEAARSIYARDASHLMMGRPLAVALPATAAEVQQVLRLCAAAGVPVVARGTGTGLSGGALPPEGAVVLATARLAELGPPRPATGTIRAAAGVVNEHVSRVAGAVGLHFAPDPSSQSAASIGGNIAENAGGPHCLRHGVTLQHLRRLEWVGADGRLHLTGAGVPGERGLDLVSLLCGAEGTCGVVTAAELALTPNPAAVATLLAFFPVLDEATRAVLALLGAGLLPVAIEMVDQAMLQAVEAAFGFGFPTDVAAAMIVEFGGAADDVQADAVQAASLLTAAGARSVRRAVDDAERAELWKCRKKAFGAVGRLAPSYVTMDVVVPLGELPHLVAGIQRIKARHGVEIATAFHAGDGNLHPGVHYDDRDPDSRRRAHAAADEIMADALARGGSVTGEHGVGIEKLHALPWQMDAATARLHRAVKQVCDPANLLNPGKLLPAPEAVYAPLKPVPDAVDCRWADLTVTAPVTTRLSAIQAAALPRGLWLPLGLPGGGGLPGLGHDPELGRLLDHLTAGPALLPGGGVRDLLLESWAVTGDGQTFHCGAPVFKNVAGYGLPHMLCGSGGAYVRHLAATFALRPAPAAAVVIRLVRDGTGEVDLAPVRRWLAEQPAPLVPPLAILDREQGLWLVLAGRPEASAPDTAAARCRAAFGPLGWRTVTCRQGPFAAATDLLAESEAPPWALAAATWTWLAPLPEQADPVLPGHPHRLILQVRPDRVWVPDRTEAPGGWYADTVVAAGEPTGTPPPVPGVPRDLLRDLRRVFDPAGALPSPSWLQGEGAARA